ncbi:TlpA disulfide reductase family protein [Mesorhizobium sp. VK23B]|uniref:TlpA disulfide reductase family protein n=1 Tax=Mesorhizobium dulcispinae TaxID=3072316 RepID=A0ABU4XPT6_9HYPH|nr:MULTISPECIES: TlpA disulfide reductase family protein [unclassified Mesorhizobium]MDX8469994.1 TlpA disulfide reductase family protein [Mesorhizobium sp. VK23B]MDX8476301.1 TlpA disulfide reductase family protein [Mesorhizobium sp. VK23A]
MALQMESQAPPIKVETWLRGEPFASFQPGKVYVVEFWATWCGPCAAAALQLVQLQEKYKDAGLEVVGVAADEDDLSPVEVRAKLGAWLAEKCPDLNYRIAFDPTGEMNKLWREPSFSVGIPTSFVVDRDGHIAFIGHPRQLDEVLPKVLNGSWRASDEAKAADTARIARSGAIAREQALKKPINDRFWAAIKAEDWTMALSAIEEGIALMPDNISFRLAHVHLLLHRMNDMQKGMPVMRQLVRDAIDRNSENWMLAALGQLFSPAHDHSHFPSGERFAMGKKLSEHILALNPPQADGPKFRSYPAVARYYYDSGNKDRAIELLRLALKSLEGPELIPDAQKQHLLPDLLQTLASYKAGRAVAALSSRVRKTFSPRHQSASGRKNT